MKCILVIVMFGALALAVEGNQIDDVRTALQQMGKAQQTYQSQLAFVRGRISRQTSPAKLYRNQTLSLGQEEMYEVMLIKKAVEQFLYGQQRRRYRRRKRQSPTSSGVGLMLIKVTQVIAQITDEQSNLNIGFKEMNTATGKLGTAINELGALFTTPRLLANPVSWFTMIAKFFKDAAESVIVFGNALVKVAGGLESFLLFGADISIMAQPAYAAATTTASPFVFVQGKK